MSKLEVIEKVEAFDKAAADAVKPHTESRLARLGGAIGKLGDEPPMLILAAATLAAAALRRDPRLGQAGARMLAAELLAILAKNAGKGRVDRTRPAEYMDSGHYKAEPGGSDKPRLRSFPSGHSAGATAVAAAFARDYPHLAWPARGAAAMIAALQLPRKAHWPSDIAAGIAVGLAAEWLASRVVKPRPESLP